MSDYKSYRSKRTVRARKVEEENGETVVTHRGPTRASRGDYVLSHDNGDVHVVAPKDFEDAWDEDAELVDLENHDSE